MLVLKVDDAIHRVTKEYILSGIEYATQQQMKLVVIELNTPGGGLNETREIVKAFMETDIPIMVYVTPKGGHAASAGIFILLAADYAIMAPGTNTGAASPITLSPGNNGEESENSRRMMAKAMEDTAAFMRSITESQKRNEDPAVAAVTKALAYTAVEAVEKGLIDSVQEDIESAIKWIKANQIKRDDLILKAEDLKEEFFQYELNFAQKILSFVAQPQIMYALLMFGLGGLGLELRAPGLVFPGVLGAISLLLFAYASTLLPLNVIGVALVTAGVLSIILESHITSYGLLTIGGAVGLFFGGLMLFDEWDGNPLMGAPEVPMEWLWTITLFLVLVGAVFIYLIAKTYTRHKGTGDQGVNGEIVEVIVECNPKGKVEFRGEIWSVKADKNT